MNRLLVRSKNNKGSTLIIVIVVVALIAILATTTLTTAMVNYRMKVAGGESKKSFYTAEEAVDQIYTCFGMLTMTNLNDAYTTQMSTITRQTASGQSYLVSNERCNSELREKFIKDTVLDLFNDNTYEPAGSKGTDPISVNMPVVMTNVQKLMNGYLEKYDKDEPTIQVKSVGACRIVTTESHYDGLFNYSVEIDDIAVEYKNEQGYFSNVTVNTIIGLPDLLIAFTDVSESQLLTFGDYAIIGCEGVKLNDNLGLKLNNAKLYAGSNGVVIGDASKFETIGSSVVTTRGDVLLSGSDSSISTADNATTFVLTDDSRLYCNNLRSAQNSKFATMTLAGTCFVKDDLDVNGTSPYASLTGNYFGFSHYGVVGSTASNKFMASASSAVMVNGQNATLDMSEVSSFMLGGHAYVNFDSDAEDYYQMGESVALRASQEVYLVPDDFLKKTDSSDHYSNPLATAYKDKVTVTIPDSFFAKKYLDTTEPCRIVTSGSFTYYYLNILPEHKVAFINDVIGYKASAGGDSYKEAMRRVLFADILELQQNLFLTTSTTANVYTSGAMVGATLVNNGAAVGNVSLGTSVKGDNIYTAQSTDSSARFSLVTQLLYEPEFYLNNVKNLKGSVAMLAASEDNNRNELAGIPTTIMVGGQNVTVTEDMLNATNIFVNFINEENLADTNETNEGFTAYVKKGDVTIGGGTDKVNINTGIVISTGDVTVENDFDGLIFAKGTVTVANNVTVKNSYKNIDGLLAKLTSGQQSTIKNYFKAWGGTTTATDEEDLLNFNISGITYKHIIDFTEWRKSAPVITTDNPEETTTAAAVVE